MTDSSRSRTNFKLRLFLLSCSLLLSLMTTGAAWAVLNDVAIYRPNVDGAMTSAEQEACAFYINYNISPASKTEFAGCGQDTVDSLVAWMNTRMQDGKSDLLLIIDVCPAAVFQGQTDGSLAEQWMESGNMLIWTGSEPFARYVDVSGMILEDGAGAEGASKVLDVSTSGLCRGGGLQDGTTAVKDYHPDYGPDHPEALKPEVIEYTDGDYHITEFREYKACNALKYDQLLIDALSSDWNHMSYWRPEEIFAENSESYQSDNIVLVNTDGGEFGQFYCGVSETPGFDVNAARRMVIAQVLNNWVNLPCNTIVVAGDGSGQFATIQEGIAAAQHRDTVLVKEGVYNEELIIPSSKRGIKLVSDASDNGNDLLPYPVDGVNRFSDASGYAEFPYGSKQVQRRAFRTVIDGTGLTINTPMIDFPKGSTLGTVVDGFTVQKMPQTNHQVPGHAHVIQTRGGAGTIINNLVRNNGSSGLGSHAQMWGEIPDDPNHQIDVDFRYTNIKYDAHPILINNVVHNNEGNNLGNNHYSYAMMYNNECFESISFEGHESPTIGCQHGAHPLIVKNLVYKSAWVGIGSRKGEQAGMYPVNRPSHPVMKGNWVFDAGIGDSSGTHDSEYWEKYYYWAGQVGYPYPGTHGAGIGGDDTGGYDPKTGQIVYQIIEGNFIKNAQNAAIACRSADPAYHDLPAGVEDQYPPDLGYVKIINNTVIGGGMVDGIGDPVKNGAGIGINGAHAVEIRGNICRDNDDAGIGMRGGGGAHLVTQNTCYGNGRAGIGMEGAQVDEIRNNVLYQNSMAGIGHDGIDNPVTVQLETENLIYENGMAGIGVKGCHSRVEKIDNNECRNNGMAGIGMCVGASVGEITNNKLHHNVAAGIGHDGGMDDDGSPCTPPQRVSVTLEAGNIVHHNGAAGIGIVASDVMEIRGLADKPVDEPYDIYENNLPGITVVAGSTVGNIAEVVMDHNGVAGCTTGMSILDGSSAVIRDSSIGYSGMPCISIFDAGTNATIENCMLHHSGQSGQAPVLTVQAGATTMVSGTSISYSHDAPNVTVFGGATLTMFGCNVSNGGAPGIDATDSLLDIQNTVIEDNGTRGIMAGGCDVTLKGVVIRNNGIGGAAALNTCVGSIKECEFYNHFPNELSLEGCVMNIERNIFHHHTNINSTIQIASGSQVNVYHNTISNLYNGEPQGTTAIGVDFGSSADVRNNIIYRCLTGVGQSSLDLLQDDADAVKVGTWTPMDSYIESPSGDGSSTCTWSFTVDVPGDYRVYAYIVAAADHATNAPYTINYYGGAETVTVNQTQNNNTWVLLGTYHFESGEWPVVLSNNADNSHVMAAGIKMSLPGRTVTASTNCYYVMANGVAGEDVLWANPLLTDTYALEPYSLCIDAAEPISGVNDTYSGNGPDIGAKEFSGTPETLSWKSPSLVVNFRDGYWTSAKNLRDDSLGSGMQWGSPWVVYDIGGEGGRPVRVYGFRFYIGGSPSPWKIYSSDNFSGPWTLLTGWWPQTFGNCGPGLWDERWANFVSTGRYIKIEKTGPPSPLDSVTEFDVYTSDTTVDAGIVIVDNPVAQLIGTWYCCKGGYGSNYHRALVGGGECTSTWTPEIPVAGDYDVYVRWITNTTVEWATNAPYTINYEGGSGTFLCNQTVAGNQWIYLGTFPFAAGTSGNVVLSNNADGSVAADAIMFIRR